MASAKAKELLEACKMNIALGLQRKGKHEEAIVLCEEVLRLNSANPKANFRLEKSRKALEDAGRPWQPNPEPEEKKKADQTSNG